MKIDGGCHCGAIAFEAEADPATASICHCTDCQAITGTAFRVNVSVPAAQFTLLKGEPARYLKTTADSGNKRIQAFCPACGTQLFATAAVDNPPAYTLRVGTLSQRNQITPKSQNWTQSAQSWLAGLASLPGKARNA
ncbi:MAG: GFA family protein [Pseudolabrys sp.]|nr:GFA family protein [Pseudolabrys sp.]